MGETGQPHQGSRTRYKLDEARFFLDKVTETHFDVAHQFADGMAPPPPFLHYLSAFLSSARSVPWVMQSEYAEVPGWKEWYKVEEHLLEEQRLFAAFAKLRNHSQKRGEIKPLPSPTLLPARPEVAEGKPTYRVRVETVTDEHADRKVVERDMFIDKVTWHVPELPDQDFLEACDRYFRLLELLVIKCEKLFPLRRSVNEEMDQQEGR